MNSPVSCHGQGHQEVSQTGTDQDLDSVLGPLRLLVQDEGHEGLDPAGDGGQRQVDHHEEEEEGPERREVHGDGGLWVGNEGKTDRLLQERKYILVTIMKRDFVLH